MERVKVTLNLSQELVERAREAGLLSERKIERWLEEELDRQQKLDRFFGKLDQLSALEPPLTEEEIDAEIEAHRREKRQNSEDSTA